VPDSQRRDFAADCPDRLRSIFSDLGAKYLLNSDGQLTDTRTGCVIDRIRDRSSRTHIAEFPETLHACWIELVSSSDMWMTSTCSMSAFTGIRWSAKLSFTYFARRMSISVSSCKAELMPQIIPPMS